MIIPYILKKLKSEVGNLIETILNTFRADIKKDLSYKSLTKAGPFTKLFFSAELVNIFYINSLK